MKEKREKEAEFGMERCRGAEFEIRNKQDVIKCGGEIKRRWDVELDEDLTMKERRIRWKLIEKARVERRKRKRIEIDNRRIWIEEKEWRSG